MWGEFDRYPVGVGGVHTKESFSIIIPIMEKEPFSIIILIMESVEGVLVKP